ncbi:MAG: hypothetical protein JSS09_00370 [Verrucomicrobia bacterium]|nr:hypothetical protein [Verrucomicrobiota bacterium]
MEIIKPLPKSNLPPPPQLNNRPPLPPPTTIQPLTPTPPSLIRTFNEKVFKPIPKKS